MGVVTLGEGEGDGLGDGEGETFRDGEGVGDGDEVIIVGVLVDVTTAGEPGEQTVKILTRTKAKKTIIDLLNASLMAFLLNPGPI